MLLVIPRGPQEQHSRESEEKEMQEEERSKFCKLDQKANLDHSCTFRKDQKLITFVQNMGPFGKVSQKTSIESRVTFSSFLRLV